MKKMPCLFERDFTNKRTPILLDVVTPGCEWVLNGEGIATRKWDGTACMIRDGRLYKRYDAKHGKQPPVGFEPAQDPDPVTGHWPGWLAVDPYNPDPSDVWIALAWWNTDDRRDWTYEACGPRIGGNERTITRYQLIEHGDIGFTVPLSFAGLREFLRTFPGEGIVFWRGQDLDCEKVKIRRHDFGFEWPLNNSKEAA